MMQSTNYHLSFEKCDEALLNPRGAAKENVYFA